MSQYVRINLPNLVSLVCGNGQSPSITSSITNGFEEHLEDIIVESYIPNNAELDKDTEANYTSIAPKYVSKYLILI